MIQRLIRRLGSLLRREALDLEVDEELRYHLEQQTAANERAGMSPEAARAEARRTFGGVEQSRELCRDARGVRWLDDLWQDARFGARSLAKRPGFTAVALATLALGIGANTAIFSVIDAVLLRPLPYADANRVVLVWEHSARNNKEHNLVSPANFSDWREQASSFETLAAFVTRAGNLTGGGAEPEEVNIQHVAPGFFEALGATPVLGRALSAEDDPKSGAPVVVLSYGLWQRRYGGDRDVVGRSVMLDGQPRTVVGVMPREFQLTVTENANVRGAAGVWVPLDTSWTFRGRFLMVVGKLKPGVTIDAARTEMNYVATQLEARYPENNTGFGVRVVTVRDELVGNVRTALLVLSGAVGLVLLIACANVANLLLMRAATRRREIAMRAALGAGRMRVVRQLLTESLCLSALGGVIGLALALKGTDLLLALAPEDLVGVSDVHLDVRVLAFTLAVSVATGLVFGLVPALQASSVELSGTLKEGGRHASADRASARLSSAFVVSEVALALVLLIGAGLLVRSFAGLRAVDPGFRPEGVVASKISLPAKTYAKDSQCIAFFASLVERARAMPGVRSASIVSALPFGGEGSRTSFLIDGRPAPTEAETPDAQVEVVDPAYFETMGIPVLGGRTFTAAEEEKATHVIIVSESLAHKYWPGESPLGKRIKVDMMDDPPLCEIVGVVGDVRDHSLEDEVHPTVYWPHPELPFSDMSVVIRADGDTDALYAPLRAAVRDLDPDLPMGEMRSMDGWMADSLARSRFTTLLLAVFGAVAFALATVGIYGVLSYAVALRTTEIGVRMALGAGRASIIRMVLRDGLRLSVAGLAIGLVAALLLNRFVASLLFDVTGTDVATYAAASLLFLAVSVVACAVPARRALAVDPIVALR
jgi:putative ABC transport system permease protein